MKIISTAALIMSVLGLVACGNQDLASDPDSLQSADQTTASKPVNPTLAALTTKKTPGISALLEHPRGSAGFAPSCVYLTGYDRSSGWFSETWSYYVQNDCSTSESVQPRVHDNPSPPCIWNIPAHGQGYSRKSYPFTASPYPYYGYVTQC